jgi:hypothetical protein
MALHCIPPLTLIVSPINYRPEKEKKKKEEEENNNNNNNNVNPLLSYLRGYVIFSDQSVTYCCLILSPAMLGWYLDLTICI